MSLLCQRCNEEYSAEAPGFVTKDGLPVHVKCQRPGEFDDYYTANNGHGYQLKPEYDMQEGAHCSNCGRGVMVHEYSHGRSQCCGAPVIGEEEVVNV